MGPAGRGEHLRLDKVYHLLDLQEAELQLFKQDLGNFHPGVHDFVHEPNGLIHPTMYFTMIFSQVRSNGLPKDPGWPVSL